MLERGRAHPILGPLVVLLLVVLLAMVIIHTALDGHDSATEVGILCVAIITVLGPLILERFRRATPGPLVLIRGDRGPPARTASSLPLTPLPGLSFTPPLRR